jgi:YHS domain-containing protein
MKFLLPIALLLSAVLASADNKPKDKLIKCAVMNIKTSMDQAIRDKMYTDYKGRRYFFCCSGCPAEFKTNPAKYAKKAESIPTPKPPKKG